MSEEGNACMVPSPVATVPGEPALTRHGEQND